ncbi:hypothetical protein CARUB_v10012170mg, partial [Capsella rubella]
MANENFLLIDYGDKIYQESMENEISIINTVFAPSKDVVATSVLSKRWRYLWKDVKTFIKNSSVESLHLKISPHIASTNIKCLVNMAVARSSRELRIEMVCYSFELPKSFYIFSQLETVILEKLGLMDVPPDVHMPCLKRLHLLSVNSLTNVMIFKIDVPTLKILSIDNTSGKSRPKGVHGFVINTPSLSVNVVCDKPCKFLGSLVSTQYISMCTVTSQTAYGSICSSFLFLDHLELCLCSAQQWNLLTRILNDAPRLRVLHLKL